MELNNDLEPLIGKKVEVRVVLFTTHSHLICRIIGILGYDGSLYHVLNLEADGQTSSIVWLEPYMEYEVTLSGGVPIIRAMVHSK